MAPPDDAPVVFVSDVHLHHGGEAYLGDFLAFLRSVGVRSRTLFIHGDLFDFYVGPRQGALDFYRPLFEELGRLVSSGVRVAAVRGNRDFLIGRRFAQAGVEVLPDESTLELGRFRVHLSHGDQFCVHDHSYLFWARGVLRAVSLALWLARRYRHVSHRKKRRLEAREQGRLPSILDGVRRLLERDPHDVVVCGHIHHLAETAVASGGTTARLLTTGAWEDGPNYILFDGVDFQLCRFDPTAPPQANPGQAADTAAGGP